MSDEVKPRRRYDSTRRRAQVERTRADIIEAAAALFVDRGYAGTTLAAVAQAAGVVVETIYRGFGGKARLLTAVVEAAVAGGAARAQTPVDRRAAIRAVASDPDARGQLARYAATQPGVHARMGPLLTVLAAAASTDPELQAVWDDMQAARLAGMQRLAQSLADKDALRTDVTAAEAADLLWTLCSHPVYDQLVVRRGWTPERYEAWLADALTHGLLSP